MFSRLKTVSLIVVMSALAIAGPVAWSASEDDKHEKAAPEKPARSGAELAQACAACHGADGVSISPEFPNIAGQYRSYLIYSLKEYRSGNRDNAVMLGFVAGLSDKEIENLADFYSKQEGLKVLP